MNSQNPNTTLPADIPTTTTDPTTGSTTREGVNAMAPQPRQGRKRAWDEMSETDRQVLLETARLRRELQAVQDAQALEFWALHARR